MKEFACRLRGAALAGALLLAPFAAPPSVLAAEPKVDDPKTDAEVAEVVVTGSRLRTSNETSSQPISTVGAEAFEQGGALTAADALNEQPQFGSAFGAQSQDFNSLNQGFNVGTELINLRNLGPQRTLVLVNGRRHVAADPGTSAVDLNSIPADMIDRIEIVTGANSAVYGADAVSGVVNVILKKGFEGTKASLNGGLSGESDGREYGASLLHGGTVGDRLSYLGAIEFSDRAAIFGRDRDWIQGDGSTNAFTFSIGSAAVDGGPWTTNNGSWAVTPTGTIIPWTGASAGPLYRYQRIFDRNLQVPTRRAVASGKLDFTLNETATLFAEATYARTEAEVEYEPQFFWFRPLNASQFDAPVIPASNPFLQQFLSRVGATSLNNASFNLRRFTQYGVRSAGIDRDLARVAVGARGEVGKFDYEVYYQYGRVKTTQEDGPSVDRNRFFAALNGCRTGDGTYGLLGVNYTALGCTPFDPFGVGNLSQSFINYSLIPDVRSNIVGEQHVVSAYISGEPFTIGGAPLGVVLGAEYRDESTATRIHPSLSDRSNGIRQISAVAGSGSVSEAFAESRLPLFDGRLEIGAAARFSDYSTTGSEVTRGLNLGLRVVDSIRLRGSYGRATRAPNVNELFAAVIDSTVTLRDPCANDFNGDGARDANVSNPSLCTTQLGTGYVITEDASTGSIVRNRRGGNLDLDSETADTLTLGVVFSAPEFAGLSGSIDYYDIKMEDVIGALNTATVISQCYAGGASSSAFCSLIARAPSRQLQSVNTQLFNIAAERVRGIDVQARMRWQAGPGTLGVTLNYAHLLERSRTEFAGAPELDFAGRIDAPDDQLFGTLEYGWGAWSLGYTARVIGSSEKGTSTANRADPANLIGTYWYHDARVTFDATDRLSFTIGGRNLGDKQPPLVTEFSNSGLVLSGGVTAGGVYDVVGRYVYASATARF